MSPTRRRAARRAKGQFLFLGGRYVRDRSLSHALNEAYRGLLMVGRMPVAFLHLEIPPEEVDVNVHPTKIEVRFRDSQRVYSHLLSTLRQTFLKSDLHARLQPARSRLPRSRPQSPCRRRGDAAQPRHEFRLARARPGSSLGRFDLAGGPPTGRRSRRGSSRAEPSHASPNRSASRAPPPWAQSLPLAVCRSGRARRSTSSPPARRPTTTALAGSHMRPCGRAGGARSDVRRRPSRARLRTQAANPVPSNRSRGTADFHDASNARPPSPRTLEPVLKAIQVHDSYLIAETGDGMMVIDQHALHERILYEELRSRVAQGRVESQRLLVPEPVDLTAAEAAAVLEQGELLAQLGLEVEPFGGDTVLVRSIPAMLPARGPRAPGPRPGRAFPHPALAADPRRLGGRASAHGRLQGGRQGRPAAVARGDRGPPGAPAPRRRLAPLPARPAHRAGLHQGRAREAVRQDLKDDRRDRFARALSRHRHQKTRSGPARSQPRSCGRAFI